MASSALPPLWRCWRNRPITCGSNSQFAENHRVFGRQVQVRYGNFPPEAEVSLFGFLPKLKWENPDLRPTLRTAFWVRIAAPIDRTSRDRELNAGPLGSDEAIQRDGTSRGSVVPSATVKVWSGLLTVRRRRRIFRSPMTTSFPM